MKFNVQITRVKAADEEAWGIVEADNGEDAYDMVTQWITAVEDNGDHDQIQRITGADWDEVYSECKYESPSVGECIDG